MTYQSPLDYEFIRIPLPIQKRKKDLPHSAMIIYGYLAKMHFTNENGYIRIVNKQASKDLKLSEKTIKEAFNILSGFGLIHPKKMGRCKGYKLMPINPDGYPETIPDYERPKKSIPKFLDKKEPSTRGVLNHNHDNRAPGGCSVPSTRGVLYNEHQGGARSGGLPYIRENKELKEMLPQGIFLKKHGNKIPPGIEGKFKNSQLDEYYEKYGDEFLRICIESKKVKLLQRARYIQGATTKLENKEAMKYEKAESDQSERYKADLIIASQGLSELMIGIGNSI